MEDENLSNASTVKNNEENNEDSDSSGVPEGEYEVEAVREKRIDPGTGTTLYFLKWKGWAEEDNTWEPLENLSCHELIRKFEEDLEKKKLDKIERLKYAHRSIPPPLPSKPKITLKLQRVPVEVTSDDSNDSIRKKKKKKKQSKRKDDIELSKPKESILQKETKPSVFDNSIFRRTGVIPSKKHRLEERIEQKKPKPPPPKPKVDLRYFFQTGSEFDKILTMCELNPGELTFFVEYKDGKKELIPNEIVKRKFTQELIAYYEENIKFVDLDYKALVPPSLLAQLKLDSDSDSDSTSNSSCTSSSQC